MPDDDTSTTTATDGTTVTAAPEATAAELAAEVEKLRGQVRTYQNTARHNASAASELEKLRQSTMSETEKAVAEAKKVGAVEARAEYAQRLAAAEIKAALAGVIDDPQNVVDDLNLAKYVTDDGDVDTKAVAALRDRWVGIVGQRRPTPDFGQGNRGSAPPVNGNDFLRQMRADKAAGRT